MTTKQIMQCLKEAQERARNHQDAAVRARSQETVELLLRRLCRAVETGEA